jgi:predicted nucleic acid-binding Zn ribbon protein
VYVYRRRDGSTFEVEQRMAEDALVECPTTRQRVERVLQPFTPRYTGAGFYATDHRTTNGAEQASRTDPELTPGGGGGSLHHRDAGQPPAGGMLAPLK